MTTTGGGGRFALQHRAGIQFHFLRGESGARRRHRIHVEHRWPVPLMVFSMPSSTSTTPGIFLIALATCGAQRAQQFRILREQLDHDRLGRAGEIADHVLQELREFHVQHRFGLLDFGAHGGDHLFAAALRGCAFSLTEISPVLASVTAARPSCRPCGATCSPLRACPQNLFHVGDHALVSPATTPQA